MPYTELAKDEHGNRLPMTVQTSLNPPSGYETKVELEKTSERLQLLVKPMGCSIGTVAMFVFFWCFFLPIMFSISITVAPTEGRLWYIAAGVSAFGWILFPFGLYKSVTTSWVVVVEDGQVKIQEKRKSKLIQERVWPCSSLDRVEVLRRRNRKKRRRNDHSTVEPAGLVFFFPDAENFLDRRVLLCNSGAFDDNLLDWMAREVAQRAEATVVIPLYESTPICCG